jgi:hypothetical protein
MKFPQKKKKKKKKKNSNPYIMKKKIKYCAGASASAVSDLSYRMPGRTAPVVSGLP